MRVRCDQCAHVVANTKSRGRWKPSRGRALPVYIAKRIADYLAGCARCGGHTGTYA